MNLRKDTSPIRTTTRELREILEEMSRRCKEIDICEECPLNSTEADCIAGRLGATPGDWELGSILLFVEAIERGIK